MFNIPSIDNKTEYYEFHSKEQTRTSLDDKSEHYAIGSIAQTCTSSLDDHEDLIEIPWNDDNFSLCLDTFPASHLARTKYNKYPTIASPLRKHWCSSKEEEDIDEDVFIQDIALPGIEEEKDEIWIHDSSANSSTATITKIPDTKTSSTAKMNENKSKKRQVTTKTPLSVVIGASFPYNNNGNFVNSNAKEKKNTSSIITRSSQRSRVEHISPLTSSSIIFNHNDIFNQPLSLQSLRSPSVLSCKMSDTSSNFSNISSAASLSNQHRNDSQISTTTESWKLAQRKLRTDTNSSNSISSHISTHQQRQYPCDSPLAHQNNCHHLKSGSRSGSITPSRSIAPTINSNISSASNTDGPSCLQYSHSYISSASSYYTPTGSMTKDGSTSTRPYRSIVVPKNSDKLVIYSNESSFYTPSELLEKSESYSDYFKPEYQPKKKRSNRKKSVGLFTKLMKNLKHHFIKGQ